MDCNNDMNYNNDIYRHEINLEPRNSCSKIFCISCINSFCSFFIVITIIFIIMEIIKHG